MAARQLRRPSSAYNGGRRLAVMIAAILLVGGVAAVMGQEAVMEEPIANDASNFGAIVSDASNLGATNETEGEVAPDRSEPVRAGKSFTVEDVVWEAHDHIDPQTGLKRVFYYNTETGKTTWSNPLKKVGWAKHTPLIILIVSLIGFTAAIVGRIYYLSTYYPELLWPTLKRKERKKKQRNKGRGYKHSSKLSQDGKGGRSANS